MSTRLSARHGNPRSGFRPVHTARPSTCGHAGHLVVGVDGSPESEAVLEWAVTLGDQVDLPVLAVTTAGGAIDRRLREAAQAGLGEPDVRRRIVASVGSRHPDADVSQVRVQGDLAVSVCQMAAAGDFIVVAEPAGSAARSTSLSAYYRRYARCAVLIPPFEKLQALREAIGAPSRPVVGSVPTSSALPGADSGPARPTRDDGVPVLVSVGAGGSPRRTTQASRWFG